MRVSRRPIVVAALVSASLAPGVARAGGGGRNVLVVVNENSEESLEIGNYYLHRRGIPVANLCRIRTTTALTTDKPTYQAGIEAPVLACIAGSPYRARLDYLVLTRGVPILAGFPGGDVSTTALLQAMDTPLRGKDQEFADPYGIQNYPNPYRGSGEWFAHARSFGGMSLYLATMLSGYWSEEAKALVDRSIASDGNPPTAGGGSFFLEEGVPAADVRNADFPSAVSRLAALGQAATHVGLADPEVTGAVVAGHVNSGSYSAIGKPDIDSNIYPPGCIVDVLESYGLTPSNFTPGGRAVAITSPAAGSRVAGSFPATIELTGGGIDVVVRAEGLNVGGGTGSSPLAVTSRSASRCRAATWSSTGSRSRAATAASGRSRRWIGWGDRG